MKAAILERLNHPLVVDKLELPVLDYGQVLVEVKRSGICGAQLGEMSGVKGEDKYLPHLMGHEGGGIVLEIGPGVSLVKKNDNVVMHWRKGAGIECKHPKYKRNENLVGGGWVTTFNDCSVVSENRLTVIPNDIPYEIAALMGCAVTTALGLINNEANLKIGQSIAVAGCGGVGLNIIQGAALVSAYPIIAIDLYHHKLELAKKMGATHIINSTNEDMQESIHKLIGKAGVDVFIDCSTKVDVIAKGYQATAPGGRTIMVGQPHIKENLVLESMVKNFTGKILMDSQGGLTNPNVDIPRYLNLYRNGKLKLDELITHRFSLDEINLAVQKIKDGETGRCMIEF